MIAREWRGVIRAEQVEEYIAYIWATGGGEYGKTPGNRGAWVMSRVDGDRAEIVALSLRPLPRSNDNVATTMSSG